jgi:hypothetical protein
MARDFCQCLYSTMHPPLGWNQPHFQEEFLASARQTVPHPRRLQWHKGKAVSTEQAPEPAGQAHTNAAFGIKANPTVYVPYICNFCIHRILFSKKRERDLTTDPNALEQLVPCIQEL